MKRYIDFVGKAIRGDSHDYTRGSLRAAIGMLAIPMILELSLESIFAVVDIYFVSKLGENAIATVGFTESIITIVYSIAIGLSTAATAIVARRVGEKDIEQASQSGFNALVVSVFFSIVLGIIGLVYAKELLLFMGADDAVISEGLGFTRIMFGTNIVIVLLFLINGIFRGAGDASLAMRSLWIASILNIILDPILIYGIGHWAGFGLEGAAIATVIGRGVGVAYQLRALFGKKSLISIKWKHVLVQVQLIRKIVSLAWPATFQFIIASGSWIILTKLVAEHGGMSASAGYQIAIRNIIFFILPAWGLSNAAATLVGQNLGAGNPERAEASVWLAARYNTYFMLVVSIIFIGLPVHILRFFTDIPEVIEIGVLSLRVIGAGYIFYGLGMVIIQSLNGAGDTRTPTVINFFCFWMVQVPLAYLLSYEFEMGVTGVILAIPIAESVLAAISIWIFKRGRWKTTEI